MNLGNLKRSLRLADLAPLARLPNVEFYSLQKGAGAEEVAAAPAGFRVIDLTAQIADFADSAALLTELDLIISVDTSVAHLAGAMGAPVWVPLSFAPTTQLSGGILELTVSDLQMKDPTTQVLMQEQRVRARADSMLGVPGLMQAVRSGNVAVASPLGSGITGATIYVDKGYHAMGMAVGAGNLL